MRDTILGYIAIGMVALPSLWLLWRVVSLIIGGLLGWGPDRFEVDGDGD